MITFDVIAFTNDAIMNQFITTFVYITAVLCSFFAAFSLISR